jgi:GTP-binding protein
MHELGQFNSKLLDKPMVCCGNKIDIAETDELSNKLKAHAAKRGLPYFAISAATQVGVPTLINKLREIVSQIPDMPEEIDEGYERYDVRRTEDDPDYREVIIDDVGGIISLSGKQLGKIFESTNFSDPDSLRYFYKYLEDKGVVETMLDMGLKQGDEVMVMGKIMDWK